MPAPCCHPHTFCLPYLFTTASSATAPAPPVAQDPWGHPAQGWAGQAAILSRKYANVSLADRLPQAMWRGRIKDERYPQRDALRWVWGGWVGGRWWTRWAAGNLLG